MAGRKTKTAPAPQSQARGTAKPARRVKPTAKKAAAKKVVSKKTATKKAATPKNVPKKAAAKKPVKKPASTAAKRATNKHAVRKVVSAARKVGKIDKGSLSEVDGKILAELSNLAKYIRAAKREIAAIRPDDVKMEYLPKAADELDAVVEATAEATNAIMDACEIVEGVMGDVSAEASAKLMEATTSIYEACTFQDITGQRITKVVKAMKHIEERIDALMDAFGSKRGKSKAQPTPRPDPNKSNSNTPEPKANSQATTGKTEKITDADLLEGPQLGGKAKSQAEIDDLFASFD